MRVAFLGVAPPTKYMVFHSRRSLDGATRDDFYLTLGAFSEMVARCYMLNRAHFDTEKHIFLLRLLEHVFIV